MNKLNKFDLLLEHILVHYRWFFVLFLLPASLFYQIWESARSYIVFQLNSAPKWHDRKVKHVQSQIKEWRAAGMKTKLCTSRPGWQTMSFRQPKYKKTFTNININLIDVLEIDETKLTVRCEPLVNMGQLSRALAARGYVLPVVPEIDDLTVGGLVMGTGVETSSHIHGLFQNICVSYELVLADASVVVCSESDNPDLFYSVPWSYGTLGFLTVAEIKIVPMKKFVRLQYNYINNMDKLIETFQNESLKDSPHDLVEGLVFGENEGIMMTGDFTDEPESDGEVNNIGMWYKPWFYTHAYSVAKSSKGGMVEYIPVRDYYHRHTRSLFWEVQDIIPFGNNALFRLLFGWLMPPKVSLLKRFQPAAIKRLYEKAHVIQDMLVPIHRLRDALNVFREEIEVYPMWLCPMRVFNKPGMLKPEDSSSPSQMYVDIGVYGVPKSPIYETVKSTRAIEDFVIKRKGFQMLYADTFCDRDQFREMFSHQLYDAMREKLSDSTEAFPEIYDKICRAARD